MDESAKELWRDASNRNDDPYRTFPNPRKQNYSAKYLNICLYAAKRRPGLCRDKAEAPSISKLFS